MRIHQITDLHIPDADDGSQFEHVRPNVIKMMCFIDADPSDLLVISGDLTMRDGSQAACTWLRDILPGHIKTIVIPGNHDDPSVLLEVFGPEICVNEEFCFSKQIDGWKLIFVNTHTDTLPEQQIKFLRQEARDTPAMLFIHHPPDLISDGFMTLNQPLLNHDEVSEAIRESMISDVFCGHYHNAIDKDCDGFQLHLTPSPAFQIRLDSETFTMEPFQPAVRVIEANDKSIETYLNHV
jgi:Icc protein